MVVRTPTPEVVNPLTKKAPDPETESESEAEEETLHIDSEPEPEPEPEPNGWFRSLFREKVKSQSLGNLTLNSESA